VRRVLLDRITRLAGWLRRAHRAEVPAEGPVKVNLGSSLLVAEGWVNVDGALSALVAGWPTPALRLFYRLAGIRAHLSEAEFIRVLKSNRFVHYNLEYGIPLPDESADYAFASHFLEHLSKHHGEQLMRETLRVLKPGGVVRIAIPDLAVSISAYEEGRKEEAMDGIFEDWELGDFSRHRYMYDFDMLALLLSRAGFTRVSRCEYREGEVPDLEVLDNRPGSLVVEAAKPG
jgi:SAM-dependent methyltransferase